MSHPTVERPDEALVRARLDALATAMDLVPERTGGTLHLDRRPAARARRGPAVRMAGAAAAVLIVAAIVAIGASRHDDGVALSTAGATLTDPPPPVAAANPATGDQVSELPVVPATPSDGFDLSDTGSWPGRGDLAAPRSTPEVAVRSYLAAALGETTAAGSTLHRWPVVTVDGAVTVSAALPSGHVVSVMSFHEAGGGRRRGRLGRQISRRRRHCCSDHGDGWPRRGHGQGPGAPPWRVEPRFFGQPPQRPPA